MLEPRELQQVEQHVRRCSACAAELRRLRATVAMLGALEEVPVPASFRAGLHERLLLVAAEAKASNVRELTPRKRFKWAMPAASVAAAAAVALGVWQFGGLTAAHSPKANPGATVAVVDPSSPTTNQPTRTRPNGGLTQDPNSGTSSGGNTTQAPPPKDNPVTTTNKPNSAPATHVDGGAGHPDTQPAPGPGSVTAPPALPTTVETASVQTTNATPATTYTQQTIAVSYRVTNPDGINADFWLYLRRAYSVGVTPQSQPVDGGVQYVLTVDPDQVDNVLAELGARGRLEGQVQRDGKDVTANVLTMQKALRDAEASGNQQEIAIAKLNLLRQNNLLKETEMRVTLLTK